MNNGWWLAVSLSNYKARFLRDSFSIHTTVSHKYIKLTLQMVNKT